MPDLYTGPDYLSSTPKDVEDTLNIDFNFDHINKVCNMINNNNISVPPTIYYKPVAYNRLNSRLYRYFIF